MDKELDAFLNEILAQLTMLRVWQESFELFYFKILARMGLSAEAVKALDEELRTLQGKHLMDLLGAEADINMKFASEIRQLLEKDLE